jgi:hypothetical protein
MSKKSAIAVKVKMVNKNTSKIVGNITVRIPWKMQKGIINCPQKILIFLVHGGIEYLLNLLLMTSLSSHLFFFNLCIFST